MRDYGKVSTAIFTDPKSVAWNDEIFRIAIYLLAGPHSNLIGCFRLPLGYASEDLSKPIDAISKAFEKLEKDGWILFCQRTKWVWIRKYLLYNQFESQNVAKAAIKAFGRIPPEVSFYEECFSKTKSYGKWKWNRLDLSVRLTEAKRKPNGSHSDTLAIPEPEPEPEPEPKPEPAHILKEAVSIYNEMAGRVGLSRVQKLTPTRQKHLRARLEDCGGLDGWRTACAKVEASSFLRGEESDRGWKANFDFMMRQSRFTSLMEGQYDRPAGRRGSSKESPSERFERMKREGKL